MSNGESGSPSKMSPVEFAGLGVLKMSPGYSSGLGLPKMLFGEFSERAKMSNGKMSAGESLKMFSRTS